MLKTEISDLFVRADVQCANHNQTVAHLLRDITVRLKLEFLGGIVLAFQIQELAPEQSDPFRIVGKHRRDIGRPSDIGV